MLLFQVSVLVEREFGNVETVRFNKSPHFKHSQNGGGVRGDPLIPNNLVVKPLTWNMGGTDSNPHSGGDLNQLFSCECRSHPPMGYVWVQGSQSILLKTFNFV